MLGLVYEENLSSYFDLILNFRTRSPEQVECMPLSSTGLHLKSRAPPQDAWNGQIMGYRVLNQTYSFQEL